MVHIGPEATEVAFCTFKRLLALAWMKRKFSNCLKGSPQQLWQLHLWILRF